MIHTTFCTFFFFFFNDTATTEIYTLSLHDALPIYLEFTERVSAITGPDGEYTLEYLTKGSHVVGIFDCEDRKSTRLNSSHMSISYAVFCLKKKKKNKYTMKTRQYQH